MKNTIVVILVIALIVCSFFAYRSCRSDSKLSKQLLKYEELKSQSEASHDASLKLIDGLTARIGQMTEEIVQLETDVAERQTKINLLSDQLAAIVGQEPPTTPDIEAMPIVINLRAQVATLTEMFALASNSIIDKDIAISKWEEKYNAQVKISAEWKNNYDMEYALRVQAEELFKSCEHSKKVNKLWGNVKAVALGLAAGVVVSAVSK
jgi:septal ring factor EnvC (AmiA/AmiB activator)